MSEEDEYYDETEDQEIQDPALKGYNSTIFKVQHVVSKALKYALIGALVGAAALAVGGAVAGWVAAGNVPLIGGALQWLGILSEGGREYVGGFLSSAAINGLIGGAVAGGAIGLAAGATGMDEAADDEEDRLKDKFRMRQMSEQRDMAMKVNLEKQMLAANQQQQMLGLAPNLPFKGPQAGQTLG